MTRNRSQTAESQDIVPRRLRRGSVTSTILANLAVLGRHIRPGEIDRVHHAPESILPDHISTELWGVLRDGYHLSMTGPSQPLDGLLEFDTPVRDEGFGFAAGTGQVMPRDGYPDFDLTVEFDSTFTGRREATLQVLVDGEPRALPFPAVFDVMDSGVHIPSIKPGHILDGQTVALSLDVDGAPVCSKVRATMQLVDRQVGEVNEPAPPAPESLDPETSTSFATSTATTQATAPPNVQAGQLLVAVFGWGAAIGIHSVDIPSGWDELIFVDDNPSQADGCWIGTRVADTDDETQSRTYTFSATRSGANVGAGLSLFALGAGVSLGAHTVEKVYTGSDDDGLKTLSVAHPGGGWALVMGVGRNRLATTSSISYVSPAVRLHHHDPDPRRPNRAVGQQSDPSDIVAEFDRYRTNILVAVAVS